MTDPNMPPERVVAEPDRHTTVNVQPERRSGGGGVIAFLVGGLIVVVAIIGYVLYTGGTIPGRDDADTSIDVDVNLPDVPRLPDAPTLPPVEPPSLPQPGPQPAN
ncbi:hypothetical protein [Brevundimonas sp. R86498]|uniref:hypothetical protein n=1 Tax=Brevundimonas sp. R86498 TaxID=3093845 RepID=UPI0037C57EE3